jgi:hypothetical protein
MPVKSLCALAVVTAALSTTSTLYAAAISLTGVSPSYGQNFDTLPSTGTPTFVQDSTISGWYGLRSGNGTTIIADAGSGNAGGLYSYGSTGSSERALGSIGSGGAAAGNFAYVASFTNGGATAITSLAIDYVGEQWRNSAAAGQTVAFGYRVGGASVAIGDTDFTALTSLDYTSPITGGTAGLLNGNLAANRVAKSGSVTGLTIAPGASFWLRWSDPDHSGTDHGLSIDDFNVTASFAAANTSPSFTGSPYAVTVDLGDRSSLTYSSSVSIGATDPNSGQQLTFGTGAMPVGFFGTSFTNPGPGASPLSSSFGFQLFNSVANGVYNLPITVTDGIATTNINVAVTVIPEPASLGLLGAMSVLALRRR